MEQKKNKKPIFKRWWFWGIIILIIFIAAGSGGNKGGTKNNVVQKPGTQKSISTPLKKEKERQVSGKSVDLGAGTFTGGKDVSEGLYDVTPVAGQGNFVIKSSKGELVINEILGSSMGLGVLKVRTKISNDDQVQIQGISKVHFEPVTSPFVKSVQTVNLYSGRWTVGEDIAQGRYKAQASSGSGNFIISKNGFPVTNEIIGESGVKDVTVNLSDGEIMQITNLNQVTLTPVK